VDIKKWLDILRDPVDGGKLIFIDQEPQRLQGETSGLQYEFVGPFPDLRPDAGFLSGERRQKLSCFDEEVLEKQSLIASHYDKKPCENYLYLDNVPLGKYLKDEHYKPFFSGVNHAIEVGSGKGAIAQAIKRYRDITLFCIDIAYGSLLHIRKAPLLADGVIGSNLKLPLASKIAELVISYGVIHHTTDPFGCLKELSRILKPGGRLLLNVYNWENPYRSLYFFFSPPLKLIRHIFGRKIGDIVLKASVFLPYYLLLWLVLSLVQGKWRLPDITAAWNQFCDFFLTPIARFYHKSELFTMGEALGLRVIEHETGGWPNNSFAHFIWYEKEINHDSES